MFEVIMAFLGWIFIKPEINEGLEIFILLISAIDFPLATLSLIFYQILNMRRTSPKQILLNNINILFILGFCIIYVICMIDCEINQYIPAKLISVVFVPPVIFLCLQIFTKQNYIFYNLVNLWWAIFWAVIFSFQYSMILPYIVILIYMVVLLYKLLLVFIFSFFFATGLYLLGFYHLYIFDWAVFYFAMFFPIGLFIFSFIKLILWLVKARKEILLNQDSIDLRKLIISIIGLGFITALFALTFDKMILFSSIGWILLIPFVVLLLFVMAKIMICLVKRNKQRSSKK